MRSIPAAGKSRAYFLKVLVYRPEIKLNNSEKFPVFVKDAAEIAAIIFTCAALFAAICVGTILFLEWVISTLKQTSALRLITEM